MKYSQAKTEAAPVALLIDPTATFMESDRCLHPDCGECVLPGMNTITESLRFKIKPIDRNVVELQLQLAQNFRTASACVSVPVSLSEALQSLPVDLKEKGMSFHSSSLLHPHDRERGRGGSNYFPPVALQALKVNHCPSS